MGSWAGTWSAASRATAIGSGQRAGRVRRRWTGRGADVTVLPLELTDDRSVRAAAEFGPDAVVHLAAVASNRRGPGRPRARLDGERGGHRSTGRGAGAAAGESGRRGGACLVVSSGEVYGPGAAAARRETDAVAPASALRGEQGGRGAGRAGGVAPHRPAGDRRPTVHPHRAGPGRRGSSLPAFAARLREARAAGARRVRDAATWTRCAICSTCGTSWRPTSLLLALGRAGRDRTTWPGVRECRLRELFRTARRAGRSSGRAGAGSRAGPQRPTSPTLSGIRPSCGAPRAGRRAITWSRLCGDWWMPKRTDLETILLIGSGPDRDRAGSRVRLLRHPGGARAQGGGLPGRPGQLESRDDHDRPGAGRPDLHRAGDARVGGQGDRAGAARRAAADHGRPDRAQRGDGAPAGRHARALRRRADRGQRARHPDWRRTARSSPQAMRRIGLATPQGRTVRSRGGGARGGGGDRLSGDPPALVHPGRHRGRHRLQPGGVRDAAPARAGALAGGLGAGRAERHRLEGVRARGDARRRRQRRDRLLDREPRSRWACTPATRSPWRRR